MGSRQRSQRMGVGYPQITNPETIGPGMPFLVESYTPGESRATTIMTGFFMGRPSSDDHGRVVKARVRVEGSRQITMRTLRLGLDLGFYGQAYRRVYRLPSSPF